MASSSQGTSLGGSKQGPLSTGEMREHRLRALSGEASSYVPTGVIPVNDIDAENDADLQAALALSLQYENETETVGAGDTAIIEGVWKSSEIFDISEFHSVMWGPTSTENDKTRWVGQGIDTQVSQSNYMPDIDTSSRLTMLGSDHTVWGLTQENGGPCGVLAAIQAELLRLILFGSRDPLDYPDMVFDELPSDRALTEDLLERCLAMSIALILARAAVMPAATGENTDHLKSGDPLCVRVVLPALATTDEFTSYGGLGWDDLEPWYPSSQNISKSPALRVFTVPADTPPYHPKRQRTNGSSSTTEQKIYHLAHRVADFLQSKPTPNHDNSTLNFFRKPGGVILMVLSLVLSRGSSVVSSDMDDPTGTKLTSQFGHCGQELINLLLSGQAVSNVFDNTMTPSGSLTCRGIQYRTPIGYLSQLESLRYCEVGGYYKSPKFPIWVVGSTSHFTVVFGGPSCLKESKSDELLERCRRAFKEVDGEENGFISKIHLGKVYELLGLDIGGEHAVQTLAATLEVSGTDIILWDDFWKASSRLMTGASLESVLHPESEEQPLRLTQFGEPSNIPSNEEAKRSTIEWGTDVTSREVTAAPVAPTVAARPATPQPAVMSDEELARKLQAEWDAEVSGTASVNAVSGSPHESGVLEPEDDLTSHAAADDITTTTLEDEKMSGENVPKPDFEKFGDSFALYHYNGLRGGTLTPFRVTRLSPEEAVGASIALSTATAGWNGGGGSQGGGGDLEDVVRTKWPSCMINWLGKPPPFID